MCHSTVAIIITLTLNLLAAPLCADAQLPGKKIPRIGYLLDGSPMDSVSLSVHEAFEQGLRDLGWVVGQQLAIEYRYAEGKEERLPELAAELVRLPVDVIVVRIAPAVQAAIHATRTIPIVMAHGGHDPVEAGFVPNLAHPGGNVTGVSMGIGEQFAGKWVELLKEVAPQMSRLAVLWDPTRPAMRAILAETERAAQALSLRVHLLEARDPSEVAQALVAMTREGAEALIVMPSIQLSREIRQIGEFTAKRRLPAIVPVKAYLHDGLLMAYGPNMSSLYRRGAYYVDRILKGAKPGDLPVEQPTTFELVINLKTAKALGLTIPPTLLFQADEVIQ
ncbi:MAG TPA: ABC transporter substrate-binding protein [Candidatus Tectomicrobia bacterium]